jgi:hypothetical protein
MVVQADGRGTNERSFPQEIKRFGCGKFSKVLRISRRKRIGNYARQATGGNATPCQSLGGGGEGGGCGGRRRCGGRVGVVVDDDDGPEYPTSKYGVSRCVLVCKLLPP